MITISKPPVTMPELQSPRTDEITRSVSSGNVVEPELATPWSAELSCSTSKNAALSEKFVWPEHEQPTVKHDAYTDLEIPVIDLAGTKFGDETTMMTIVSQMKDASRDWGFFQVVNHGIPQEVLARVQKQALEFFRLPLSEKMKLVKQPGKLTGYGHATVKKEDVRPWSEGFYLANDGTIDDFSRKLWPQETNKDFVDSYKEYNEKLEKLAHLLMHIIIKGLEVDATHFERYLGNSRGLLRWNYYPPCPEPDKTLGLTAHTDFNLLTILHQGDIGGLQVEKDGDWVAVRPNPGALAINLGDTFQVLTNGKYKSIPHRAVVNRQNARISLAYFFLPSPSVDIVPCPDLISENDFPLYKPFTLETYTKMKQTQMLNTLEHFRA